MTDKTPPKIRGYTLKESIGSGGVGVVYRAFQDIVERDVAVKVISQKYANHPEFIRRFQIEAQTIARLEHPHIIPLYDYWRDPQGAYLVMRWVRNGSLRQVLENQQVWTLLKVAKMISQLSGALYLAHQQGVIHRDIKPENILLDSSNNAYLADFGIAIDLQDRQMFEENLSYGSPHYAAPEQFTRKIVTPQTDIYSLGILIFELLTGETPFEGESTIEVMKKHHYMPLPSVRHFSPQMPPILDQIIWRATDKAWENRYASTIELANVFNDVAQKYAHIPAIKKTSEVPVVAPTNTNTLDLSEGTRNLSHLDTRDLSQSGTLDLSQSGALDFPEVTKELDTGSQDFTDTPSYRNPYKGLQPFYESDASDFFGRDSEIDKLLDHIANTSSPHCLALVGASGSGKSSLIRAGIIPKLRQGYISGSENWFITTTIPGSNPLQNLEESLLTIAVREPDNLTETLQTGLIQAVKQTLPEDSTLLLFIDQFEEVFTLGKNEKTRQHFLDIIQEAANSDKIYILLTLRADFYDRPLAYPKFAEMLQKATQLVLPLTQVQLQEVIQAPAKQVGLELEPNLAKLIAADVSQQASALPLLQYTLSELYEEREDNRLTYAAYQSLGGVSGALAKRADIIYNTLPDAHLDIARQIFLRLVIINDDAKPTRQRAAKYDVISAFSLEEKTNVESIIDLFSQHRLLTSDRDPRTRLPTIEIAHEALLSSWKQMQTWIQDNQAELRTRQRLDVSVTEWQQSNKDKSFLATGAKLAEFEQLQNLNDNETAYIQESLALRTANQRRRQVVIAGLTILTLIAIAFAGFAFIQRGQAIDERNRADMENRRSTSGRLAAVAQVNIEETDLALLLDTEALNYADTFEARNSLLTALQQNPYMETYMHGHTAPIRSLDIAKNTLVTASADQTVIRWDATTHTMIDEPLAGHNGVINAVAISDNAALIASGGEDRTVRLWDAATGEVIHTLQHDAAIWSLDFSADSTQLITGSANGTLHLWETVTGEEISGWQAHTGIIFTTQFNPDGTRIVSGGEDNITYLWNPEDTSTPTAELTGHENWVMTADFNPNGDTLATSGADLSVILWDANTGERITRFGVGFSQNQWVRSLDFDSTGDLLAVSSRSGSMIVIDLTIGQSITPTLRGHTGEIWSIAFYPQSKQIASTGTDDNIIIWNLDRRQPIIQQQIDTEIDLAAVATSGDMFAVGGGLMVENSAIDIRSATDGELLNTLEGHTGSIVDLATHNNTLASVSLDRTIILWNLETGEQTAQLGEENLRTITGIAFSPDGTQLFSAEQAPRILIWDVNAGQSTGEIALPDGAEATSLAVSPDGLQLATGYKTGEVVLWDIASQQVTHTFTEHTGTIRGITFSPDGKFVVSASEDTTLRVWDIEQNTLDGIPLEGHRDWVMSVNFGENGQYLVSTGEDQQIILWDWETRQPVGLPLLAHTDTVTDAQFSGDTLISVGADQNIYLWEAGVSQWVETACSVANRSLTDAEIDQYFLTPPDELQCK